MRGGPTGGSLADVELKKTLLAGTDPVAIDAYAAKAWWDLDYQRLPFLRIAEARGLGKMNFEEVRTKVVTSSLADDDTVAVRSSRKPLAASAASRRSLFFAAFLFLLFRAGVHRVVPGRRRARSGCPGRCRSSSRPIRWPRSPPPSRRGRSTAGLLWSLVILVPTLFLGRFFCGWICPLGTLNHFFGSLQVGEEARQGAARVEPLQALAGGEVLRPRRRAAVGRCSASLLAGLLDPISLTVRSLALSILPGRQLRVGARCSTPATRSDLAPVRFGADALAVRAPGHARQLQAAVLPPGRLPRR